MANRTSFKPGQHASPQTEFRKGHRPHNTGKQWPKHIKDKISQSRKGQGLSDETKRRLSIKRSGRANPFYGKHHSHETRAKIQTKILQLWQDREYRAKTSISNSQARLRQWRDPKYALRQIALIKASGQIKPNKAELALADILNRNLPEFRYNGDFRLGILIGGFIPDFINVNGRKEVIELFGRHWHTGTFIQKNWRRSELGRLMAYNSLGWKCLVIWDNELKDFSEHEIVAKILTYFRREHAVVANT